jgi:hypothetical protein
MKEKITINDAKNIAKELDLQAVVILTVNRKGGIDYVTYGEDRKKCNLIGWWAQNTIDRALSLFPFRTHFGWGNEGVPKDFSESEWNSLTDHTQDTLLDVLAKE